MAKKIGKIYGGTPKLGSGARFKKLTKELEVNPKIENPAALAASIGRKKFGAKKFQKLATAGKKSASKKMSVSDRFAKYS